MSLKNNQEGEKKKLPSQRVVSIPFSEKTSNKLKAMLVGVVEWLDKARIRGYDIPVKLEPRRYLTERVVMTKEFIHNFSDSRRLMTLNS